MRACAHQERDIGAARCHAYCKRHRPEHRRLAHNLMGGSLFVELVHFPFVDARGPLLLKFHSQAQGGRCHWSEVHLAPTVLLDGIFY